MIDTYLGEFSISYSRATKTNHNRVAAYSITDNRQRQIDIIRLAREWLFSNKIIDTCTCEYLNFVMLAGICHHLCIAKASL